MKAAKVKQDSLAELPVKTPAQQSVAIPALTVVMGLKEEITWTKNAVAEGKGLQSMYALTGSYYCRES